MAALRGPRSFQPSVLVKPSLHDPPIFTSQHLWITTKRNSGDVRDAWDSEVDSDAENSNPTSQAIPPSITALSHPDPIFRSTSNKAEDVDMENNDARAAIDTGSESDTIPSLYDPSDSDEISYTDDTDDDSMSIGSSDTFSTETDTGSNSLSSFIVSSSDESREYVPSRAKSLEVQKRRHEDATEHEPAKPAHVPDPEDQRPKKYRRLYLRPRSVYDTPTKDEPNTSSSTLTTYVSTNGVNTQPVRPDFMAGATGAYFAKEKFSPAYPLTPTYKERRITKGRT